MEEKLKKLFDYQRFERNPQIARFIMEAENRKAVALSDDDLDMVAAAGEDAFIDPNEDDMLSKLDKNDSKSRK